MKAMSEAGLERGRFFTLDICSESLKGRIVVYKKARATLMAGISKAKRLLKSR